MNNKYIIPELPLAHDLETKTVLKQLNLSNKKLAELKGVALTIPNEDILINSLTLQEAKDSSEVENIVTTNDELYKAELDLTNNLINASTKEVLNYRQAMRSGFMSARKTKLLTLNDIKRIQQELECNNAGFRSVPGTSLKNQFGDTVYTPPQDRLEIERLMANLELYINDHSLQDIDPLIKMAIIHHQFESIHPFYDGNGRTGRIISILYLITNNLLDLPILYLSRYITHNKGTYYKLIQDIRNAGKDNAEEWEQWILFMLKGVEETANDTIQLIKNINILMSKYKQILRPLFGKLYKHELLNNLFFHPYTKIEFVEKDMMVQRKTATKYLDMIVETGLLEKIKIWKTNYYINTALMDLFINRQIESEQKTDIIESVHSAQ
ncbi:Fic family protein [uncultured Parabacteroides sp.]|jgi:Fic family protein|uniref:Fic family protein n=1 Tax=uncultured Parabacteroides sp. TaxID=512312 RepID=UPI0025DD6942|nr:Fic/DOC family N-terminal domain-containing protein [uncultured Parabacteroides sp.]